jgi:hypothetical protein
MGIEPTWPAWKAGTLPLSYTRLARPGARKNAFISAHNKRANHNSQACLVNLGAGLEVSQVKVFPIWFQYRIRSYITDVCVCKYHKIRQQRLPRILLIA